MTRHKFQLCYLRGVALKGEYFGEDIAKSLITSNFDFTLYPDTSKRSLWTTTSYDKDIIPIRYAVAYAGEDTKPRDIIVTSLELTCTISGEELKQRLTDLLKATNIQETDSQREQFDSLFQVWEEIYTRFIPSEIPA